MEYISYIIIAIVAFWIGSHWKAYQIMQNLISRPDDMITLITRLKEINQETDASIPEDAHPMQLERVGDQLYAYDKHSGEFLGQAASLDNLIESIDQRFPNKKFFGTISADNPAKELVK